MIQAKTLRIDGYLRDMDSISILINKNIFCISQQTFLKLILVARFLIVDI